MRPIQRYHFSELPSTNDKAKELCAKYAVNEYLAVTTDVQTQGRGRNGKVWLGEYNENVYCSFAVRYGQASDKSAPELASYQVRGALAVLSVVRSILPPHGRSNVFLKYPNDVYMFDLAQERKKICGVLVEHEFIGARCVGTVIGIGVNVRQTVFSQDIAAKASSLLLCGIDVAVEEVITRLLEEWERLCEMRLNDLYAEWWRELALQGVSVALHGSDEQWKALCLNTDGTLVVENQHGEKRSVLNGDSVRRLDW